MHIIAIEPCARFLCLAGPADGDSGDGMTDSGNERISLSLRMRSSRGCTPSQQAPKPSAWAHNNRFSMAPSNPAADSSTPRSFTASRSPQTTMPSGDEASISPYGNAAASEDNVSFLRTTTNRQGSLATADGAAWPPATVLVMIASSISPAHRRECCADEDELEFIVRCHAHIFISPTCPA